MLDDVHRCARCNDDFAGPPAGTGKAGGKLCPACAAPAVLMERSYRVRRAGLGWAAYNRDADRVSPVFRSEAEAQAWADRRVAARQPQIRPCLRCRQAFASVGPQDRLCPRCGLMGADITMDNSLSGGGQRRTAR